MHDFEGRIVVASSTGKRVVLGAMEHSAVVIDLDTRSTSTTLETTFDAGGKRLALSDEMGALLAAAYHTYGLASYCCRTGRELWRRKDLKKVQRISLSADGITAYCGREDAPLAAVDLRTGETTYTVRGARGLYESRFDLLRFVDTTKPYLSRSDGGQNLPINRLSFAFLDVCFGPGLLVLSESGGPVRCFDTATGLERWRYEPMAERHVLHLGYQTSVPYVLGVEWPYVEGGSKRLIRWSPTDGTLVDTMILGRPADCCFGLDGEVVVLSDGRIIFTAPHRREGLG